MRKSTGLILSVLVLISSSPYSVLAADCSLLGTGFRPALPTDSAVINGKITVGTCYDPKSSDAINAEYEDARRFLLSRYVIGPRSAPCIKTKEQGVDGLNKDFAVRVARLMQDMEKTLGGQNVLRSAYRPSACGGGVGHSGGCAVDIEYANAKGDKWRDSSDNPNVPEAQWIRTNGGNERYRLHFPFPYPPEWHHVEPMDRAGCLAGRNIDPSVGGVQATAPAGGNPIQQATRNLQNFFSPPQPVTCTAGSVLLNGTCVPTQTTQTVSNPYRYITETATNTTPVSTSITGQSQTQQTVSAIDLISDIANPTTTVNVAATTGQSVALNDSLRNSVALHAQRNPTDQKRSGISETPPAVAQTFTSDDLSKHMRPLGVRENSTFTLLERLRTVLVSILETLRPFGGTVPHKTSAEPAPHDHEAEYGF